MRPERLYLQDIVEAAETIAQFVEGETKASFVVDKKLRSAALLQLIIIGEAAARLPAIYKQQHGDVPWQDATAFRNFAVHVYFAVKWETVWETVANDVPSFGAQVAGLLAALPVDSG